MKKWISLFLTLMLALAVAAPAAAADTAVIGGADGPTAIFVTTPKGGSTAAPARPSGVSVQVNGENVTFPNASPAVINGRTMVPMRAVLEALGATVDYDGETGTVQARLGDVTLTHVIGTDAIQTASGEKLTMDTTSYTKNGSTLVPLRFFSQALGYEVYWDEGARTAVVIDKAAAVAKIDESFTILNDLQAKQRQGLDGDLAIDMDFSGEAKLLDSISGDKALPFSMKLSAIYGSEAMNAGSSTIGGALYALAEMADAEVPVNIYKDLTEAAQLLTSVMGDKTFTKTGEDYSWKLDETKTAQLAEALGASAVDFPFTMEMTVKADGSSSFSMELAIEEDPIAVSMTLSGTSSKTESTVKGRLQVKNVCDVTFQGSSKISASDKAPVTAPPADAAVIDLDNYAAAPLTGADLGIIGGADGPTAIFVTAA